MGIAGHKNKCWVLWGDSEHAGRADVEGGRSNEVLVLVQARTGVASELSEEGTMDSGKILFRGTNGWRRLVEDRIGT